MLRRWAYRLRHSHSEAILRAIFGTDAPESETLVCVFARGWAEHSNFLSSLAEPPIVFEGHMRALLHWLFTLFLSPGGLLVLAALILWRYSMFPSM
jgi:hypothetical protein